MSAVEWRRGRTVLWRRTSACAVVQPRGADEPLVLSGAAAWFWDVLEVPTTIPEAAEMIGRACGMAAADVRPELEALADSLSSSGAVEKNDPAC